MKNYSKLLLFSIFMLILVAWCPSRIVAQSTIYEVTDDGAEFSIVRHYKNRVDIVFDILVSNYRFSYVDRGAGTSITVFLPTGMGVSDFRIADDTVYFCGNYYRSITSGGALIGYFSISDVFFNGGSIHYLVCDQIHYVAPNQNYFVRGYEQLLGFGRMRVVKEYGATHLLMTGGAMYVDTANNTLHYPSVLADFWHCGNDPWKLEYIMDYFEEYTYDDIAVTDDNVVVTVREWTYPLPSTHNLISYNRYTEENICQNIFKIQNGYFDGIVPMPIYHTTPSVMQVINNICIEAMGGNDFATVCIADIPGLGHQTVISFYNDPTLPPALRVGDNSTAYWEYRELAYNKKNKTLYMIPVYPENQIRHITAPYTDLVTTEDISGEHIWFSLDYVPSFNRCVVSGSRSDLSLRALWLFSELMMEDECTNSEKIEVEPLEDDQYYFNHEQILSDYIIRWDIWWPEHEEYPLEIICE
ncbi:MAG: hypothetical protein IKP83_00375 [Bacteroidales bacterium]|nr:hypothetical protein [Bacteroidales bacterium]